MTDAGWAAIVASLAVATIAALASVAGAILAFRSSRAAREAGRTSELEGVIEELHSDRHQLWFYCRQLVDHIYRGNPPPPPPPPEGLFK